MNGNGIPAGWETVTLADVAEVRLGRQRSPDRAVGPHMRPYMRAANVTWQGIDTSDVKEMDFTPNEYVTYALHDGDILLSEASGSQNEVGKPAVWRGEVPGSCFQNTLIRVRAADPTLIRFLHLHFLKDAMTGQFAAASRGVGIHHLGAEALVNWQVTLPPLPEQHRIVAAIEDHFSRLDAAVALLERVQRNLKRYRASVLKAAVEGRLVPTEADLASAEGRAYEPASVLLERILEERWKRWKAEIGRGNYKEPVAPDTAGLPELPEGWCWASLDQLTRLVTSGSRGWAKFYSGTGPIFIRAQDINTDVLKLGSAARVNPPAGAEGARTAAQIGDLLVTITGANVTKTAFVAADIGEAYVSQHVGLCRPVRPDLVRYLHSFVICPSAGRRQLEEAAYGAGKPGLGLDNLKEVCIAFPPEAEQARIVNEVDRCLSVVGEIEQTVERNLRYAARLRQSVLKWSFEGRLADQNPADEPASVLLERIQGERLGGSRTRHRATVKSAPATAEPGPASPVAKTRS